MAFGEIIAFSYDTFCSNKIRFILTALAWSSAQHLSSWSSPSA